MNFNLKRVIDLDLPVSVFILTQLVPPLPPFLRPNVSSSYHLLDRTLMRPIFQGWGFETYSGELIHGPHFLDSHMAVLR